MIILFTLSSGNQYLTLLPSAETIQNVEVLDEPIPKELLKVITQTDSPVNGYTEKFNFSGLWYTSTGQFVEVLADNEAYIIDPEGRRTVYTRINKDGFSEEAGYLDCCQRGDETTVRSNPKVQWPIRK